MSHIQINEKDLRQIFKYPTARQSFLFWLGMAARYLFSFLALFALFFILINFPAYWQKIKYRALGQEKFAQNLSPNEKIILEPLQKIEPEKPILTGEFLPQNRLIIPKIKINTPIVWNASKDEIISKLKEGVAHYQGTSLPGENGNVFITGHSSNFWWDDGLFKQVFALLDKLENNDKIFITFEKQLYIYQVEKAEVVSPSQIEVMNPVDHSIVSLMTCYPVGTTINRLVVSAKQIYPEETKPKQTKTIDNDFLPAVR
ncbi:sortase [Candidatus Berkelbacteria bacterium]|nr:sortase [Candidatus Berkelbacteria bacterium]OIP05725.1 MAG: hypothetical protein AUK14_01205 [Candidatus Berkelbacteria bacterium CG2_30_39_44]PIR28152.1 MAG: hypothetical protein COV39_00615 [Candidatus Berkelbacteria bacterium CG11_big_fil_rev_8_21_14_0_20_40_23]